MGASRLPFLEWCHVPVDEETRNTTREAVEMADKTAELNAQLIEYLARMDDKSLTLIQRAEALGKAIGNMIARIIALEKRVTMLENEPFRHRGDTHAID